MDAPVDGLLEVKGLDYETYSARDCAHRNLARVWSRVAPGNFTIPPGTSVLVDLLRATGPRGAAASLAFVVGRGWHSRTGDEPEDGPHIMRERHPVDRPARRDKGTGPAAVRA